MTATRLAAALCAAGLCLASPPAPAWQSDNGDGSYTNPPLNADYPDPDIIRVGEDFYFATTTFANSPGLRILHSRDLVNWRIAGHVLPRLEGGPAFDLKGGSVYRRGVFAPSLRFHDGQFIIAFTMVGQHTRICRAADVAGPWRCHALDRAAFDPGLFFDTDGSAYIATAIGSDGTVTLLSLSPDLTTVTQARKIHHIPGAEGSKLVRRGDWYYLFNAVPRRLAMTISRARALTGPWETIPSINSAQTGGHQGAIVDLADGRWWGFVMQDKPSIGRITNLSPIFWKDDWPVWGTPEAPGRVPAVARKPVQGQAPQQPATSDEFDAPQLGLQWAWNHNPDDSRWSLAARPGFLRLQATRATTFWSARNTLTQKGQGSYSRADVALDLQGLVRGDHCGFGVIGKVNAHIAATRLDDGSLQLEMGGQVDQGDGKPQTELPIEHPARAALPGPRVLLRTELDFTRERGRLSWSVDGRWQTLGDEFALIYDWRTGTFQGPQYALFCFNPGATGGQMDVDAFLFSDRR
ncbi:glycoside hydrolase 43 family protein [Roseateles sp. DC23W]|uniref:Glycoside hydrolase 43 family protein n=1 Tax=Pelomonas dachongensis TaxID=3299029 RepID=A0ABW7EIR5_9BURK